MKTRVKLVLLGLMLGACGGSVGIAATPDETQRSLIECCSALTVHVRYGDAQKPPRGAWVRLTRLDQERTAPIDGRTDGNGEVTFVALEPGRYLVNVYHRGMAATGIADLDPCEHAGIRLVLPSGPR